jgi:hypothetical protein
MSTAHLIELSTEFRLAKRLPIKQAVAQECVGDPVWCFEAADSQRFRKVGRGEIHRDHWYGDPLLLPGVEEGLFHPVGLALHRVEQDTRHEIAVNPAHLCRVLAAFVGRRKDFVSGSSGRLVFV